MTTVAFVLVSWRPDTPAGMERAVAGAAVGLASIGHRPLIVTAHRAAPHEYRGVPVAVLASLAVPDPCTDHELRAAITAADRLHDELLATFAAHDIEVAVYVDALWGLGRTMPTDATVRRVLAVHVIGHRIDLAAALERAEIVVAPSATVLRQGVDRGYDTTTWRMVPNPLLLDGTPPTPAHRQWLRVHGPIRVLARLGPEKGVLPLLEAAPTIGLPGRPVEVAVHEAGFESSPGSQQRLLDACQRLANQARVNLVPGLPWHDVPSWLAESAVVIVPSTRETFGLVALEALASATPVVAFDVDNLPALVGAGGCIVPVADGHAGLWRAARDLLADPLGYERTSRAGYYQSRDYRPAHIADLLVKVVS